MSLRWLFELFAKNKNLTTLLILINLGGTAFGIYYYWPQLGSSPNWQWPFIPDSPLYTALFAACLVLILLGRRPPGALAALTALGLVKAGLWTVLVILLYSSFFLSPGYFWYYVTLLVLHAGMALEAGVLLKFIDFSMKTAGAVFAWFIVGDVFDYVIGTVPYPIPFLSQNYLGFLAIESFAATALLCGGLLWISSRKVPSS
jgi:uncharacterized membrane protein YpjA